MILQPPGFFGKLPSRGDFLVRRVPKALAPAWDEWLGILTAAVRDGSRQAWPEIWLTAPLWHFALGSAIAPPFGAAGALVASVDRVGRMFPFTIIGPGSGIPAPIWSDRIEALLLEALGDDYDPDALDAALVRLGAPPEGAALRPDQSFWRSRGSDRVPPTAVLQTGLPDRGTATAMVLGAPEEPGS